MHYKLVVTDEMERLVDERVGYLLSEFKSNQAASHLLDGIEEIYDYLEYRAIFGRNILSV